MDSAAATPPPSQNHLSQLNGFRQGVRFFLAGILVLSLGWVNLNPHLFPDLPKINLALGVTLLYLMIYNFFLTRFLTHTWSVYTGSLSLLTLVATLVFLTGGNDSIFIGYLYLFIWVIGLSLGFIPLITTALVVEIILLLYLTFLDSQQLTFSFIRNSLLNLVSFLAGYFIMREYGLRGKEYAQIESLVKQQQALSREKDELISIISHEFRTPVSAIKGYLDLLKDTAAKTLSAEQGDFLKKIEINLTKLQSIMENTLNVSVIESGVMTLFLQPVDLEKLVNETVNTTLKIEAESKQLYLTLNLPKVRLPLINADPQRLKQIITNLVDNAVKYTNQGGIGVTLSKEGNWVVLSVADTGRGISEADLPQLFQKFFRSQELRNRVVQGTGLGLYITKRLIEKHHGTIEVASEVGRGTTFIVKLPIPAENETWS